MAFGTPTDGGAAYSIQNGTSVAPAYPASIAADDVLVLIIGMKPSTANGGTVTTPSGWTLQESLTGAGGYGTTTGADVGNTNLWIYTKDTVAGTETGNLTVTVGTNNVCWGLIIRIPGGGSTSFSVGTADGSRTTAPTSGTPFTTLLTNGATAPNLEADDVAIWAMCIPTDVLNNGFTNPTISSTGTTFGTAVELEEPDSGTGNDIGGYVAYAIATAGSSTAAPTVGVTATGTVTNVRGPIALIRIRDTTQPLTPSLYTNTNTFYAPTVTKGAVTLSPARYDNTNAFYTPDVTQTGGGQTLTPARYDNTNTFYSATATATRALNPALYANTNVFYSATVLRGSVTLNPTRYDNSNTFYLATISQASNGQNIAPNLYSNTNSFFSANIANTYSITFENYVDAGYVDAGYIGLATYNTQTFYAPTLVYDQDLAPSRFNNSNTFFSAVVTGGGQPQPIITTGSIVKPRRKFKPSILLDVEKKPEPAINANVTLSAVSAQSKVFAPTVTGTIIINAEIRLGAIQSMSRIMPAFAASSWNDPTDDEMIAIFALLE